MIRAVLFDLDGTLLDRRATFQRHLKHLIAHHPDLFDEGISTGLLDRLEEMDNNGYEDRRSYYRRVAEVLGLAAQSAGRLLEYFEECFPEECVPMPHVQETLSGLARRGYRLGLITNGREKVQSRKLDGLGIREYFDVVVISEVVGVRKPDSRIFEVALAGLGVEASEAAYIGDNPEPDVLGANGSGLMAIWRRDPFFEPPTTADLIIDDLRELLDDLPEPHPDLAARTQATYERQAARFDAERSKGLHERVWLDRFLEGMGPGRRVLDLGCGAGDPIAAYLMERGCDVVGVDASRAMLTIADERFPAGDWRYGDMRSLDLGEAFDGIIAWNSFFHLTPDEQRDVLRRMADHLDAGAALMITVGDRAGTEVGHVGGEPVYHASLSQEEYERVLDGAGVDVIDFVREDPECYEQTVLLGRKR